MKFGESHESVDFEFCEIMDTYLTELRDYFKEGG